jgi:LSD1 subclass zinc finger protein
MAAEKSIRIMCPSIQCRKVLAVPEGARGKTVRCKYCRMTIKVPSAEPVPAASQAPPEKPSK